MLVGLRCWIKLWVYILVRGLVQNSNRCRRDQYATKGGGIDLCSFGAGGDFKLYSFRDVVSSLDHT